MNLIRVAWLFLLGACILAIPGRLARYEFAEPHMGTQVRIVFYASSVDQAETGRQAAFAVMKQVDDLMSDYKPDSELSRLSRAAGKGPQTVSQPLFDVLERSLRTAEVSEGAFDITIGPLVLLWRRSRKERSLPTPTEIVAAKRLVDYRKLRLDPRARTAELLEPGMVLDVGGIAKGYACDKAIEALKAVGILRALVDTGGGMALSEPPPGKPGWRIGMLGDDQKVLELSNCGVSTSGDTEQFVEIGGVRYSHVIDPATGLGLTNRAMATVIAKDGLTTDALDTPICIMGAERGLKMAVANGAEAWMQWIEGKKRRRAETPGFSRYLAPDEP
ncbi:MAG TPA: FAD:protein FMN transferase [Planctomycetota bacterium]|nr:FAD:protein FMN transferase [Planctomycetota bacterium]